MTRSDGVASAGSRELAGLSTGALREFRDRERARYAAIKARATAPCLGATKVRFVFCVRRRATTAIFNSASNTASR